MEMNKFKISPFVRVLIAMREVYYLTKTLYAFANVWFKCACSTCIEGKLAGYAGGDEYSSLIEYNP